MNIINKDIIYTQTILKSEFITYLKYIETVNEAKQYIEEVKLLHPNATHHVTCFIIGKSGEHGHCNDDGEPSGTAGFPMLDVFKKNNVTNFVCIVVRYFGGVKLGAGGLIRAYSSSASLALREVGFQEIIEYTKLSLTFNYPFMNIILQKIKDYEVLEKNFHQNINLVIKLPSNNVEELTKILITTTNNQIEIKRL